MHHLLSATAIVAVCATPAVAGEEIIYEAVPAWVVAPDLDAAMEKDETLVLIDRQVRMEDGVVHDYFDVAIKMENPQVVTQLGTPQLQWQPDKGDLRVHRIQIIRDGEVIDVLADGTKLEVIRRERQLESRLIDGMLTGTMAVPGLRVGDVLRMSHSTTKRDQALDGEMQVLQGILPEPMEMGYGRIRVSWPEDEPMRYNATRDFALAEPVIEDGYKVLSVEFPIPELDEMPDDAPRRYRMPPLLQVGTYDSWRELSAQMATHFTTKGTIDPEGEIAAKIAEIEAKTDKPLERAALALQIVQDDVAYHLNGLDGGNYLPQSPEDTWELRYGDCKAKSLLLLAMLREMGIESEAVLVHSSSGDWVPDMLPMPGNFDHMIVHAVIDGEDYWLDGTNAGVRLATIGEVPPFFNALPLRTEGAELMPMTQRWPSVPDRTAVVEIDHSAGFDYPAMFSIDVTLEGTMATRLRDPAEESDREKVLDFASNFARNLVGTNFVKDATVTFDEDSGQARLEAEGVTYSWWEFERGRAKLTPYVSSNDFGFSPDRARREWRDIPYQSGGPVRWREDLRIELPQGDVAYDLRGVEVREEEIAGTRISRSATLDGASLRVQSDKAEIPVEIPASAFAENRRAASRLGSGDYVVRVSEGAKRYWEYSAEEAERLMAPMEAALDAYVDTDPEEASRHIRRAEMRVFTYDYAAAAEDYTRAIELEPSATLYNQRAQAYANAGEWDLALDDALYAYELQGDVATALNLAAIQAEMGDVDTALALLEEFELGGDERATLAQVRAEYEGEAGRPEAGWAMLEDILLERPGDSELLNSQCWHMGTWKYRLDEAEAVCTEAVQASQYGANVLDSRAMVYYRNGDYDKAMRDIDAALRSEPSLAASRYLKGLILIEQGKTAEGRREIAYAERISPRIVRQYERYGISSAK